MESEEAYNESDDAGRRKFRLLLLAGALFVTFMLAALCYGVSRPQTAETEVNERHAIRQCRLRSEDSAASPASRRFQAEACREMEKQFRSKFQREP